MKENTKKTKTFDKKCILPIVMYVIAALIVIYSIFTIYTSYTYISELIEEGRISLSGDLKDIIGYYINASISPVFYAISTWAIGYFISKLRKIESLLQSEDK